MCLLCKRTSLLSAMPHHRHQRDSLQPSLLNPNAHFHVQAGPEDTEYSQVNVKFLSVKMQLQWKILDVVLEGEMGRRRLLSCQNIVILGKLFSLCNTFAKNFLPGLSCRPRGFSSVLITTNTQEKYAESHHELVQVLDDQEQPWFSFVFIHTEFRRPNISVLFAQTDIIVILAIPDQKYVCVSTNMHMVWNHISFSSFSLAMHLLSTVLQCIIFKL